MHRTQAIASISMTLRIGAFIASCASFALSDAERRLFKSSNPWGLILFRRNVESPEQLKSLTSDFRSCVGRKNAPVFIDQEGGRVQRMGPPSNHWRAYPAARSFGKLAEKDPVGAYRAARNVGRLIARDLYEAGITADCLPVLDVPQPGSSEVIGARAYSDEVLSVIALARSHTAGLLQGGVLPVMKHIPGHGRATVDSHLALPTVTSSAFELKAIDFVPFAAFADCPMAMTAHVVYTAYDKVNPATLSKAVISKVIRQEIGFNGLLMTDDLSMKALSGTFEDKVKNALRAGCDVVLHCSGNLSETEEVAAAAGHLKGKALTRAKAALKTSRKPLPFDLKTALSDLDKVCSAA